MQPISVSPLYIRTTCTRSHIAKIPLVTTLTCFSYRLGRAGPVGNGAANGPSGIAQQLRRSEEDQGLDNADAMNLDEFLFYGDGATPSSHEQGQEGPDDDMQDLTPSANASAIPINSKKDSLERFSPQSVPAPRHENEFPYVTRHHRKTSIDERPVGPTHSVNVPRYPVPLDTRPIVDVYCAWN